MNVGMSQQGNDWVWACGCGVQSTKPSSREQAREEYKQHRRSCTTGGTTGSSLREPVAVQPQETRTMATAKKGAKKSAAKKAVTKREPAVTEKVANAVIEKLRAGKSTIMAEARHIGCYHATLRKALRGILGTKEYDKLIAGAQAAKAPKKAAAKKPAAKKAAAKKTTARRTTKVAEKTAEAPAADVVTETTTEVIAE